jgi:hypothetical protein
VVKKAIRRTLQDHVPALMQVVFDPNAIDPALNGPYAVIVDVEDTGDPDWRSYRSMVEIGLNIPVNHELTLDTLSAQVVTTLETKIIRDPPNGQVYAGLFVGVTGSDQMDEQSQRISRRIRFVIAALQPNHAVESSSTEDAWLIALANATETRLGPSWSCYLGAWPSNYHAPAVLWRLVEVESREVNAAVYEMRKKLVGHIIGNSPNEQADGILRTTEMLGQTIKLPIDQTKQHYATISDPRSNMQANALSDGQITVTLSRKMNRAAQEAPLIQEIQMQHNLQ